MADQKVSDLPSLNGADVDAADLLYIIDSSAGTAGSKKITVGQYQLAPYSAGTANGVMYLNGSNVVTTGSGLVFDGTNLGIGVTPTQRLDVAGAQNSVQARFGNVAGRGLEISTALIAGTNDAGSVLNAKGATSGTLIFQTDSTERMRLDSSGNLGIGTSSPGARLDVTDGTTAGQITSWFTKGNSDPAFRLGFSNGSGSAVNTEQAALVFAYTGVDVLAKIGFLRGSTSDSNGITFNIGGSGASTERARITSGGDLLVGTATVAAAGGITLFNNSGPGFSLVNNNNAAATGYVFESFRRSSVEIGSITQNGTTAVLYNTTSDRRLKDNIVPAPSASDVIDAIQIVSHDWKAAPDEHVTYGVIAQDLHAVAPQAVLQGDDGDQIEKTWGVDYSKLVPMLIKEIQSLRARVAALEAQ